MQDCEVRFELPMWGLPGILVEQLPLDYVIGYGVGSSPNLS